MLEGIIVLLLLLNTHSSIDNILYTAQQLVYRPFMSNVESRVFLGLAC